MCVGMAIVSRKHAAGHHRSITDLDRCARHQMPCTKVRSRGNRGSRPSPPATSAPWRPRSRPWDLGLEHVSGALPVSSHGSTILHRTRPHRTHRASPACWRARQFRVTSKTNLNEAATDAATSWRLPRPLRHLFWAGNIVLGRGLAGMVPPIALAYWRWTGAFLVAVGFAWPYLRQDAAVLRRHWRMMLLLSATGIATYNTLSYIGLASTTALNVLLLQSAGPLIIIVWAFALFGERPTPWQSAGVLLSLVGVATIAAHGSLETLLHLTLNPGDVWILIAMVIYGIYAAMFRVRPAAHPMSFLVATMGIGSLMILPFYLWEIAEGGRIEGGL